MSVNGQKTKNIPGFLQKTYTMLEVRITFIKGFPKRTCHNVVSQWRRFHNCKLRTAHKTSPTNLFQALKLLIIHQTGKILNSFVAEYVRLPQDQKREHGELLSP